MTDPLHTSGYILPHMLEKINGFFDDFSNLVILKIENTITKGITLIYKNNHLYWH